MLVDMIQRYHELVFDFFSPSFNNLSWKKKLYGELHKLKTETRCPLNSFKNTNSTVEKYMNVSKGTRMSMLNRRPFCETQILIDIYGHLLMSLVWRTTSAKKKNE